MGVPPFLPRPTSGAALAAKRWDADGASAPPPRGRPLPGVSQKGPKSRVLEFGGLVAVGLSDRASSAAAGVAGGLCARLCRLFYLDHPPALRRMGAAHSEASGTGRGPLLLLQLRQCTESVCLSVSGSQETEPEGCRRPKCCQPVLGWHAKQGAAACGGSHSGNHTTRLHAIPVMQPSPLQQFELAEGISKEEG